MRKKNLLFVTGAGISASAGVPVYRGKGFSLADVVKQPFSLKKDLSLENFANHPKSVWSYLHKMSQFIVSGTYTKAHREIAALEADYDVAVITQNIDGYHAQAGSSNVLELHGNIFRLKCWDCFHEINVKVLPEHSLCPACESNLFRPDVVLHGEPLGVPRMRKYYQLVDVKYDTVVAVGTTGAFPYIKHIFKKAKENGSTIIEINPSKTAITSYADTRIEESADKAVDKVWKHLM